MIIVSHQFICRMIMDSPEIYLSDYDIFENLFNLARMTICVTKSDQSDDNDGTDYKVYVPTDHNTLVFSTKNLDQSGEMLLSMIPISYQSSIMRKTF